MGRRVVEEWELPGLTVEERLEVLESVLASAAEQRWRSPVLAKARRLWCRDRELEALEACWALLSEPRPGARKAAARREERERRLLAPRILKGRREAEEGFRSLIAELMAVCEDEGAARAVFLGALGEGAEAEPLRRSG